MGSPRLVVPPLKPLQVLFREREVPLDDCSGGSARSCAHSEFGEVLPGTQGAGYDEQGA